MKRRGPRYRPALESLEGRLLLAGDVILEWNAIALEAVKIDTTQPGPTRVSRNLAIVHAAMFDAVNSIDGTYTPISVQIPTSFASIHAAAAQAARDTLTALYPLQQATFDAALTATLAEIPDGPYENAGIAVGQFVAAHILAQRMNDGSELNPPYTPGTNPGDWQPDPLNPTQTALTPGWGNVTPFVISNVLGLRSPPPPALNSAEYTAAYNEVLTLGDINSSVRTADQTEIGIFWGYDRPGLGTPPRLYNQIARTVAVQQGNSEIQNSRLFALINIAMADAGITIWDTKYAYNLWRPITAIRAGDTDGNPDTIGDPNWIPLGAPGDNVTPAFTPPFPAYTSGHSGFGAALFRTLELFYGTDEITFTIGSEEYDGELRPYVERTYTRFSQATEENGQSRIYLGIHWSFDKTFGIDAGNAVADEVFARIAQMQPGQHFMAIGADAGAQPTVAVFDSAVMGKTHEFFAYDPSFQGGVRVAVGDINGDGVPDIVTAAGPGSGPHVKVIDGTKLHLVQPDGQISDAALLASFYAFDVGYAGGLNLAVGELDGQPGFEIVIGAAMGHAHVRVFHLVNGSVQMWTAPAGNFLAYDLGFEGGVHVGTGRFSHDGIAMILTGAGPGAGPHVQVIDAQGTIHRSFFAFDPGFQGGVTVTAVDMDRDGIDDIVVGAGPGGNPHVKAFHGDTLDMLSSFLAFDELYRGGVRVCGMTAMGEPMIAVAPGPMAPPNVRVRHDLPSVELDSFFAFDPSFLGGVFVGGK